MRSILNILFLFLSYGSLYAQSPFIETYQYAPDHTDLLQLEDSSFILVGDDNNNLSQGVILLKTDPLGDTLWTRNYGGPYSDNIQWIVAAEGGGFYFGGGLGTPDPWSEGYSSFYVVKADADGFEEWSLDWQIDNANLLTDAVLAPDGGLYFVGNHDLRISGVMSTVVGHIFPNGSLDWTRDIPVYQNTEAIAIHPDNGFVILLKAGRFGLMHISDTGDSLSTTIMTDPVPLASGNEIIPTSDGNLILVGASGLGDRGPLVVLTKVTPDGNYIWNRQYAIRDYQFYIGEGAEAANGHLAISGTYFRSDGISRIWIGRYDSLGVSICTRLYGTGLGFPDGDNYNHGLVATADNGFAMSGFLRDELALLKTGELCRTFNAPPVGSAYPNPFTDRINLNVEIGGQGNAEVIIYNSVGQEVLNCGQFTLIDGRISCTCNTETLSQGIYLLKVRTLDNELAFKIFK